MAFNESSEFLNISFDSDSSADQPVDSAYVKHYRLLKGKRANIFKRIKSIIILFIFQTCTTSFYLCIVGYVFLKKKKIACFISFAMYL